MSLFALDSALRAATVALLLVLSASLFRDFRNVAAGRLAIAFALGSAAHAVKSGIGATTPVSISHAPLIALSTGNAVVFWLFTRALFDEINAINAEGLESSGVIHAPDVSAAREQLQTRGLLPHSLAEQGSIDRTAACR